MSADSRRDPLPERLEELLVDRALLGLTAAEESELARLLTETGSQAGHELELAAAALDQALAPQPDALPAELHARLTAAARAFAPKPRERAPEPPAPAPRGAMFFLAGWVVAAAACLVAFLAWRARAPVAPQPSEQRSELLARADTLRINWTATEQATDAGGDVVWSQALQRGVLRIRGLAPNDPTLEQFQLWIFDDAQEHPIDGGVFDVVPGEEVLIPIDAKLHVDKLKLFAITREKPGGVVVSDQQRILLVARP